MGKAPNTLNNKWKVFEETFKSPEIGSKDEACKTLEEIRKTHPKRDGWVEISKDIIELPNGNWQVLRHHAKYA